MNRQVNLLGLLLLALLVASCAAYPTASEMMTSDSNTSTPEVCQEILFTYSNIHTSRGGGANTFAICPGDTAPRMMTYGDNWNQSPRWSPDRSQIAFLSYQSGTMQVHIMDRDGSNDRQLTSGFDLDVEGVLVLPDGSREIAELIWLPDGNSVAVALRGDEQLIWQAVYMITGDINPISDWTLPRSNYAMSMSLSHDGTRIAYTERTNTEEIDRPVEIFIQDIDSSNRHQLTDTGWMIQSPVWSPDDSQIAFLSSTEHSPDHSPPDTIQNAIYTINLDSSNLHEPFLTDLNPWSIAWSPDGKSLAVIASEIRDTGDVFGLQTLDSDGTERITYTLNTLNIRTGERIILFKVESPNRIYDLSW